MQEYTVRIEGFILGKFYAVDATVSLTEAQAASFLREGRIARRGSRRAEKADPKADSGRG